MREIELQARGLGTVELEQRLRQVLYGLPGDAVVKLRIRGPVEESAWPALAAQRLRRLTPATMNLSVVSSESFPARPRATPAPHRLTDSRVRNRMQPGCDSFGF